MNLFWNWGLKRLGGCGEENVPGTWHVMTSDNRHSPNTSYYISSNNSNNSLVLSTIHYYIEFISYKMYKFYVLLRENLPIKLLPSIVKCTPTSEMLKRYHFSNWWHMALDMLIHLIIPILRDRCIHYPHS